MPLPDKRYEAIAIGTSAGGLNVLTALLEKLPASYPLPVIVVQHRSKDHRELLEEVLQARSIIRIRQAEEKEKIEGGTVYIAPPDYHLLLEADRSFSLSNDAPVRYSRPSIDVLFETAAVVYRHQLAAIILTGASSDGAAGIVAVSRNGGLTIAQDPEEAVFSAMPRAAIETGYIREVLSISAISEFLIKTGNEQYSS